MNLDSTFRTVLLALFLVLFPIGLYHRLKSQATGESLDRRQEGLFILATLRPLGALYFLGIITYMIDPAWMAWSSVPLPSWLRWTGAALGAFGGGLLLWTFRTLGPNLTDTVVTRRSHTLVTRGPYRWVRHPFYDSAAVLILATSLMAANWFVLLLGALVFLLLIVRTRTEEEKLLARFGDSYRTYQSQTGRFLPKVPGARPDARR
jgi:protein-S-isoprenylcysteine O-methyltransferase Ste14